MKTFTDSSSALVRYLMDRTIWKAEKKRKKC
jgi:hypothetical protein